MYEYNAKVTRVVDGDTIDAEVDLGFHLKATLRFRLARVDTPERGQPGFTEATDRVKELTPVGSMVHIKTGKAGGFGRWIAEVEYTSEDGTSMNLGDQLLNEGLAVLYRK
jgi:endonuclease YncB( thermonuclease family)